MKFTEVVGTRVITSTLNGEKYNKAKCVVTFEKSIFIEAVVFMLHPVHACSYTQFQFNNFNTDLCCKK